MLLHWTSLTIVCVLCVCVSIVSGCPCIRCDNNVADCSNKRLRNPPKNFPAGTQIINLNSNRFSVLGPRSFQRLSSVEVVKIRSNRIRVIRQNAFLNFRNLMTLDVSDNQIVKIYGKAFRGMNNLQTLTLSNNRLRSTSRIFSLLPQLYQLNLAFNQIRKLGEHDFDNNANVHQIDLRNNLITTIHKDTFKNLVSLRTLFLNNNPIATLPTLKFGSEVLNLLDLSECRLSKIPQVLPSSIRDLRLGKNQLTRINQSDLANVTGLKMITLNDNNINIVEYYALGNAKSLREVWLRGNKLVYIPRGLPDSVKQLHMDSNTVYQIEGRLFSNNSQLEFLDITNNQVTNISSEAFTGLKKLRTLNFQGNQLQSIKPGTFVNLKNLTFLNLANNPIEFIEDGAFSNLANLTTLNMNYNPVEEVQFEENFLTAMPNLKTLNLMASSGVVKTLLQHLESSDMVMERVEEVILTYNNIHKLSPNFREVFPNVKKVQLDGNAWICDNNLLWLRQWMESVASEVTFHAYSPAQCETPFGLNGQEILQVPESSFVAPDPNLLNDFPYWLIEEEFQESSDEEEGDTEKSETEDGKVKNDPKEEDWSQLKLEDKNRLKDKVKDKNHLKDKLMDKNRPKDKLKDKNSSKDKVQDKNFLKEKLKENSHSKENPKDKETIQDKEDMKYKSMAEKDMIIDRIEIKNELKNNDNLKDKLKTYDDMKDNLKTYDDLKDNLNNNDDMKDKLKNSDIMKDNLKNNDDMKDKLKNNDDMKDKLKNNDEMKDKLKKKDTVKYQLKDSDKKDQLENKYSTNMDKPSIKDKTMILEKNQAKEKVQSIRVDKPPKTADIRKKGRKHKRNKKRRRKLKSSASEPMDEEKITEMSLRNVEESIEEKQLLDSLAQSSLVPSPNVPPKDEVLDQQKPRKRGRGRKDRRRKGRGRKDRKRGEGKKRGRGRSRRLIEKLKRLRVQTEREEG